MQDEQPPYRSVTLYGRATLEPPVPGLTERMARRYLGFAGAIGYLRAAREAIEQSEEVTIALVPDRPLTQDFSPETPLVGRLWLRAKRVLPPWL